MVERYISVQGMFKKINRFSYSTFNDINPDLNTWKKYETKMVKNGQSMNEIQLDISDAVLNGTTESFDQMQTVIPEYQVKFDSKRFHRDILDACRNDIFIDELIDFPTDNKICQNFTSVEPDQDPMFSIDPQNVTSYCTCSEFIDLNVGRVVNRVIDFYNEDYRYTEEQYDAKMDELQAILISEDEEEIDDFLFEFYSKGLDERKIFVLSYKAPDWTE